MKTRRRLLALIALGALPVVPSFGQQPGKVWRVGFLAARSRSTPSNPDHAYDAFLQAMRDLGYVEGKNVIIEWRFANGRYERLPALAAELAGMHVDVIVTHVAAGIQAAQRATNSIPIVTASVGDAVGSGFAKSLARPGGNVTGLTNVAADITPKQVELLATLMPKLSRVAVLLNSANPNYRAVLKSAESAGETIGARVLPVMAGNREEIEAGFNMMKRERVKAVLVPSDGLFTLERQKISELARRQRLPSLVSNREIVLAGGLMSYGPNVLEQY